MTAAEIHLVDLVKFSRGPILDPLWMPRCLKCGDLADKPTDRWDASNLRTRHEARAREGSLL